MFRPVRGRAYAYILPVGWKLGGFGFPFVFCGGTGRELRGQDKKISNRVEAGTSCGFSRFRLCSELSLGPWRPALTATTTMSTFAESQLLTVESASGHVDLSVAVPFSFCVGVVFH